MIRSRSMAAAVSLLSIAGGALIWRGPGTREPVSIAPRSLVSPYFDPRAFARRTAAVDQAVPRVLDAQIVVIPHHLLASALIATTLRDIAAARSIDRILLIGPNHVGAGRSDIATTGFSWQTPFGEMSADTAVVTDLESVGLASEEPHVLTYEHSISGIVPILTRFFPAARVVPLALRGVTSGARVEALARSIARLLDGSTLVVSAVDFAHDIDARMAPARDRATAATMRSGDVGRMLSYGNDNLDSPQSIAVAMIVARLTGETDFRVIADSDSSAFGSPTIDATSYMVAAWLRT